MKICSKTHQVAPFKFFFCGSMPPNPLVNGVGVKYSTCTWYLYLSTYLSVLDVLEYLVYGMSKYLYLYLYLTQKDLVLSK